MRVIRSLCIAFSTYSRIPVPQVAWTDENRKYSMCFFPLIGAVIGLLLWGWLALCDVLGVGALLRGAVGALLPILVTGGIHMDGFMDTSDALASWQSPEKRLEILKDSHVGAFAVLGCAGYPFEQSLTGGGQAVGQSRSPGRGCTFRQSQRRAVGRGA